MWVNPKRFCYLYVCLISEKLCGFLLMFSTSFIDSVSYFFFLYRSPSSSLCTVFNSIPFSIDEVLLSNPPANVFVFEKCNVHHKGCLYYSDGTDRPGELFHDFSVLIDLTQIVNFPTPMPDCDSHRLTLLFWIFFSSDTSVCSIMAFPPLGNSAHAVVSDSIDFPVI